MRTGPNPLQELLHRHMGIDSFAIDGDDTPLREAWQERPGRARTPKTLP